MAAEGKVERLVEEFRREGIEAVKKAADGNTRFRVEVMCS
jgi:hypothetical protein